MRNPNIQICALIESEINEIIGKKINVKDSIIDPDSIQDIPSGVTIYKYHEEESGENTTIDTRHKCIIQTRLIL